MSGIEEPNPECPLCMEPLELDDINFFPCTCGYQICRFCWHRIRTDENGLCPACRKQYPEDPADFKPLAQEELQRIKNEKRQKDLQRKQKISENRKHLANVRVVQKNLVFVVGLSQRLADPEALKKHEYFGKFGKMHKVVINHSTAYAGSQTTGPSASAYVTYFRVEDALRAIQAVNNIHVDGRTLKASLGTTKYCSHFLKGQQCPKTDCMYLHELGDDAASFTKEEMQQGKHQEYEKKLHEQLFNNTRKQSSSPILDSQPSGSGGNSCDGSSDGTKESWPTLQGDIVHSNGRDGGSVGSGCAENNGSGGGKKSKSGSRHKNNSRKKHVSDEENVRLKDTRSCEPSEGRAAIRNNIKTSQINALGNSKRQNKKQQQQQQSKNSKSDSSVTSRAETSPPAPTKDPTADTVEHPATVSKAPVTSKSRPTPSPPPLLSNDVKGLASSPSATPSPVSSLSSAGGGPLSCSPASSPAQNFARLDCSSSSSSTSSSLSSSSADMGAPFSAETDGCFPDGSPGTSGEPRRVADGSALNWLSSSSPDIEDTPVTQDLPIQSNTDWQAAFGFSSSAHSKDDDLGFDPWDESSKALADLMEKETRIGNSEPLPMTHHLHCNIGGIGGGIGNHGHSLPPRLSGLELGHLTGSAGVPLSLHQHLNHHHRDLHLHQQQQQQQQQQQHAARRLGAPPGFGPSHMANSYRMHRPMTTGPHQMQPTIMTRPPHLYNDPYMTNLSKSNHMKELHGNHLKNHDTLNVKEWQDNLRALLPNINITFGASTSHTPSNLHKGWPVPNPPTEVPWVAHDPAVVSAGGVTDAGIGGGVGGSGVLSESPPHWMKSLQQLTEVDQHPVSYNGHRIPMVNHFSYRHPQWSTPAQIPPPGFGNPLGPSVIRPAEPQKLLDNF